MKVKNEKSPHQRYNNKFKYSIHEQILNNFQLIKILGNPGFVDCQLFEFNILVVNNQN